MPEESKTCSRCGEEKLLSEYSKSAKGFLGRRSECRLCHAAQKAKARLSNIEEARRKGREKYRSNPEAAKLATAKWREAHKDELLEKGRQYREENRELMRLRDRERLINNPEKYRERWRQYREANPEKTAEAVKRWQQNNPDKVREIDRRRRSTPTGRITNTVRAAVHRGLLKGGKNGCRTFNALGYSSSDLMTHLEKQFLKGMSWENFGEWHIDHILPLASFRYQTVEDEEFKAAWAITNLRPLWAIDNHKKRAERLNLL